MTRKLCQNYQSASNLSLHFQYDENNLSGVWSRNNNSKHAYTVNIIVISEVHTELTKLTLQFRRKVEYMYYAYAWNIIQWLNHKNYTTIQVLSLYEYKLMENSL